jgi:hypothetical protein
MVCPPSRPLERRYPPSLCKPASTPCAATALTEEAAIEKVSLGRAFASFSEHWKPRVVGDVNDMQVKITSQGSAARSAAGATASSSRSDGGRRSP